MLQFSVRELIGFMPTGSSRPMLVETDGGRFVLKLVNGPEGPRSLAAEWIGTSIAALLGLPTLELVAVDLAADKARALFDTEHREFVERGAGLCLGIRELKGARPARAKEITSAPNDFALPLLWLDILLDNPDRRPENPNILALVNALVVIDHASALPFHHRWAITEQSPASDLRTPAGHVYAERADLLAAWHGRLRKRLPRQELSAVCAALPSEWLGPLCFQTAQRQRDAYAAYLWKRLRAMDALWS